MIKTVPIKENREFIRLYKRGKFFVGKYLILYVLSNNLGVNRIGITASKKVGKSVQRNRLRRLVKENFRLYENFLKEWYDFVFVLRKTEKMPDFYDIKREMKFLLKKMSVFNQESWDCLKESSKQNLSEDLKQNLNEILEETPEKEL